MNRLVLSICLALAALLFVSLDARKVWKSRSAFGGGTLLQICLPILLLLAGCAGNDGLSPMPSTAARADFPFAGEYYGVSHMIVNGITRMDLPGKLVMMPDGKSVIAVQGPNTSWATPIRGQMTGPLTFAGKSDSKKFLLVELVASVDLTIQFSKDGSSATVRSRTPGIKLPPTTLYRKGTKMAEQTQKRYPALLAEAKRISGTMNLRRSDMEVVNYNRISPKEAKEALFVEGVFVASPIMLGSGALLYAYQGETWLSGDPKPDHSRPAIMLGAADLPLNTQKGTILQIYQKNNGVISLPSRGGMIRQGKLIDIKP